MDISENILKYLKRLLTCSWRRIVDISLTDRVQNEEVLHRTKAERKIPRTIKRTQADCIGHTLSTNWLLKHTECKMEGKGRRGRRRNQLLEDLTETRRYLNWKKKHYIALCRELVLEDALDLAEDTLRNDDTIINANYHFVKCPPF